MLNHDSRAARPNRQSARSVHHHKFIRQGYVDYLAGAPFAAAYESWAEYEQRNYENGRLIAANLQLAGLPTPAWREGVFQPRDYLKLTRVARARVGSFRPEPMEPDDNVQALARFSRSGMPLPIPTVCPR